MREYAVLFIVEDEVFQIKKPSHSKRIVKQLKKESLRDKDEAAPVKFEVSFRTEQVCMVHYRYCLHEIMNFWLIFETA